MQECDKAPQSAIVRYVSLRCSTHILLYRALNCCTLLKSSTTIGTVRTVHFLKTFLFLISNRCYLLPLTCYMTHNMCLQTNLLLYNIWEESYEITLWSFKSDLNPWFMVYINFHIFLHTFFKEQLLFSKRI